MTMTYLFIAYLAIWTALFIFLVRIYNKLQRIDRQIKVRQPK
ncbi:CcmD family protein [candidate division KSB1 bacterium]|nr:CcmD family protein [candidate division KSB1 bacterium]